MRKMRRSFSSLFIWAFILVLATEVWAGQASKTYTFSAGDTIIAEEFNSNFDNVYNAYNAHDTAVTAVHGMGTAVIMGTTLTQTSSNKTEVSPIITTSPTAAGATWSDLGTVTSSTHTWIKINSGTAVFDSSTHTLCNISGGTAVFSSSTHTWCDINGGTIDGTTIGATTPSTAVVTTLDTGQGANELYDMNQNVQTTDDVTFSSATVTNTFTAKTITLSEATTSYWSATYREVLSYDDSAVNTRALMFYSTTTSNASGYVGAHLPNGATVTSVKAYWYDDDAAANGSCGLKRNPLAGGAGDGMASADSTNADAGGNHIVEDTTIDFPIIDNSAYAYYISIICDPNDAPGDIKWGGVCVTYTVTSTIP